MLNTKEIPASAAAAWSARKREKGENTKILSPLLILHPQRQPKLIPQKTQPIKIQILMARLLATSNPVISALCGGSARIAKRGYAAAAAAAMRRASGSAAEENVMMKGAKEGGETVWTSSWVPDPVTGYYRPENRVGEMDPAELRQILLSRKSS